MGIRVHPAIKFMMSPWGTCWHVRHVISMTALQSASLLSSAQTPGKQYSSSTAVTSCPCLPKAESPKCQGTKLQNSCALHLSIVRCICRCACCAASCSEGLAVRPDALFIIAVVMVSFLSKFVMERLIAISCYSNSQNLLLPLKHLEIIQVNIFNQVSEACNGRIVRITSVMHFLYKLRGPFAGLPSLGGTGVDSKEKPNLEGSKVHPGNLKF